MTDNLDTQKSMPDLEKAKSCGWCGGDGMDAPDPRIPVPNANKTPAGLCPACQTK